MLIHLQVVHECLFSFEQICVVGQVGQFKSLHPFINRKSKNKLIWCLKILSQLKVFDIVDLWKSWSLHSLFLSGTGKQDEVGIFTRTELSSILYIITLDISLRNMIFLITAVVSIPLPLMLLQCSVLNWSEVETSFQQLERQYVLTTSIKVNHNKLFS